MKPDWRKYTVIILMKDGSRRGARAEVDANNPGNTRIYDDGIDRDNVQCVIGNIPGWPPEPLSDCSPSEVTLTKEEIKQARDVALSRMCKDDLPRA